MNLDDIKFIKLLPKFMQEDGCDQGIAEALDDLIRRSMYNVRSLKVWDEIETLNEKQLDELAWELDIDWYDSTADIDTKRDVLRYASSVKRKRGTSWSVQQLITAYFGQGFVYEWTEFDGQPFTFMALTTNENVDEITLKKFINAVNSAKNERSKLVGVLYLWQHDHEAAELVAYDDKYHRYKIKKCGLTPHATTIGILQKGAMTVSDASQYIGYILKGVGSDKCGRLGGHRGTLGQINKNTIVSSYNDETDCYGFKKSGITKCSDTVGARDQQYAKCEYDDSNLIYMIKHVKNRMLASKDAAGIKANGLSAVRIFNYRRCGLYRCKSI